MYISTKFIDYIKFIFISVFIVFFFNSQVLAEYEPETGLYKACIKYQRADFSWSDGYKIRGLIVTGEDLNSFAREQGYYHYYQSGYNYFVIPWENGGYTALELGYSDNLPFYEENIEDHDGRTWSLQSGWDYCY
ncbi:hypothetical protein [Succinatimonas hippei]|uniref:hypothetical protein n=1 Tax=Succinatimonas hippei TaxID=626938 RepID=UPI0023F80D72|nr:hypothetical protein [Succinatimonas hippei]